MDLTANQAFYLIINNKSMACMSKSMGEIYREERDEDGFLYMVTVATGRYSYLLYETVSMIMKIVTLV